MSDIYGASSQKVPFPPTLSNLIDYYGEKTKYILWNIYQAIDRISIASDNKEKVDILAKISKDGNFCLYEATKFINPIKLYDCFHFIDSINKDSKNHIKVEMRKDNILLLSIPSSFIRDIKNNVDIDSDFEQTKGDDDFSNALIKIASSQLDSKTSRQCIFNIIRDLIIIIPTTFVNAEYDLLENNMKNVSSLQITFKQDLNLRAIYYVAKLWKYQDVINDVTLDIKNMRINISIKNQKKRKRKNDDDDDDDEEDKHKHKRRRRI